jgi:hypothetical protein
VSLLDSLLWGRNSDEAPPKASPSSPSSPWADSGSPRKQLRFWARHGDAYGWRAHVAIDAICSVPAPDGLILWLRKHAPCLYQSLTENLPNRISYAWDAQDSYDAFDALCFELVDTYTRAVELMLASR